MRTLSVVNKSLIFGKQNKEKKVTSKEIQILQGGNKIFNPKKTQRQKTDQN